MYACVCDCVCVYMCVYACVCVCTVYIIKFLQSKICSVEVRVRGGGGGVVADNFANPA